MDRPPTVTAGAATRPWLRVVLSLLLGHVLESPEGGRAGHQGRRGALDQVGASGSEAFFIDLSTFDGQPSKGSAAYIANGWQLGKPSG